MGVPPGCRIGAGPQEEGVSQLGHSCPGRQTGGWLPQLTSSSAKKGEVRTRVSVPDILYLQRPQVPLTVVSYSLT